MRVLIACEFSGIVRDAFTAKGCDAISCDLLPTERPGKHYQGDVFDIINDGFDLMIAHPPCTYLCVSGNAWFNEEKYGDAARQRKADRLEAIDFFVKLYNSPIEKICIENPVGVISTAFKKPSQIIQPFNFGHTDSKKTCLWLKGLPNLIHTKQEVPEYISYESGKRMPAWYANSWKLPKAERAKLRSKTFQGIADAMADQWG